MKTSISNAFHIFCLQNFERQQILKKSRVEFKNFYANQLKYLKGLITLFKN